MYDILITGGQIVDGTGEPGFNGDVAIIEDRIVAIGPDGSFEGQEACDTVDATGMVVCPGFIDIQSQSILA